MVSNLIRKVVGLFDFSLKAKIPKESEKIIEQVCRINKLLAKNEESLIEEGIPREPSTEIFEEMGKLVELHERLGENSTHYNAQAEKYLKQYKNLLSGRKEVWEGTFNKEANKLENKIEKVDRVLKENYRY